MLSSRLRTSIAKAIESIHAKIEALTNDDMINEIDNDSVEFSWISCVLSKRNNLMNFGHTHHFLPGQIPELLIGPSEYCISSPR
jgi:hypothetical protein